MFNSFGLVERIREERLVMIMNRGNVDGNGGRRKMKRRWRDKMKKLFMRRRLSEREGMVLPRDREASDRMVYR